jgi:hypothetical protein
MYRNRLEKATDGFVTVQQRDHRQDDGAREPSQISQLAGPEGEARIIRVSPRVDVGERPEQ